MSKCKDGKHVLESWARADYQNRCVDCHEEFSKEMYYELREYAQTIDNGFELAQLELAHLQKRERWLCKAVVYSIDNHATSLFGKAYGSMTEEHIKRVISFCDDDEIKQALEIVLDTLEDAE